MDGSLGRFFASPQLAYYVYLSLYQQPTCSRQIPCPLLSGARSTIHRFRPALAVHRQSLLAALAYTQHEQRTKCLPPAPCVTKLQSTSFENKSTVPKNERHPMCRRLELEQAAVILPLCWPSLDFRLACPTLASM